MWGCRCQTRRRRQDNRSVSRRRPIALVAQTSPNSQASDAESLYAHVRASRCPTCTLRQWRTLFSCSTLGDFAGICTAGSTSSLFVSFTIFHSRHVSAGESKKDVSCEKTENGTHNRLVVGKWIEFDSLNSGRGYGLSQAHVKPCLQAGRTRTCVRTYIDFIFTALPTQIALRRFVRSSVRLLDRWPKTFDSLFGRVHRTEQRGLKVLRRRVCDKE
jgi:hypothetical protein